MRCLGRGSQGKNVGFNTTPNITAGADRYLQGTVGVHGSLLEDDWTVFYNKQKQNSISLANTLAHLNFCLKLRPKLSSEYYGAPLGKLRRGYSLS